MDMLSAWMLVKESKIYVLCCIKTSNLVHVVQMVSSALAQFWSLGVLPCPHMAFFKPIWQLHLVQLFTHFFSICYRSDISEENRVFTEFSKYGMVKGFKFFDKDRRMALIQMSSVSEAIEALIVSKRL